MLLFINTANTSTNVVPIKKLGDINVIDIQFQNKAILKDNLLELMCNILDTFTTEEERFLLIMNDLDDAYANLENLEPEIAGIKKSMFRSLIETYIGMGHEIVYFTPKGSSSNTDIVELEELDGFEVIDDEVKLYNRLIKDIK